MPLSYPPAPSPDDVARARQFASNPADYADEPDFSYRCNSAWFTLLADRHARKIAAEKAAVRPVFPGDAA